MGFFVALLLCYYCVKLNPFAVERLVSWPQVSRVLARVTLLRQIPQDHIPS